MSAPDATVALRRAGVEDHADVARTFALAFQDDPVFRWWIGDDADRARILPGFFDIVLSDHDTARDEVWTADGFDAAASWRPPGSWHATTEEALAALMPRFVEVIGEPYLERGAVLLRLTEDVHPREDHWYLETLGTLPERQGQGLGSALLAAMAERLDADGVPAYLESSNERNVPLYRRYGFEVTGEIVLPDDGPPLWLMWREPKGA